MTHPAPKPRALAEGIEPYRAGRSDGHKIKLSSNESPHPPSDLVLERIAAVLPTLNQYPSNTIDDVRTALAAHVGPHAARTITADDIVVGNGSVALLRQLYEAFLDPGDQVVVGWRSFEAYPMFSQLRQADTVEVPLVDGVFDMAAISAAVTEATRLVILTSPNNPSGSVIAHDEVADLLDRVPDGCLVVVDNAYAEFDRSGDGVQPLALLDHPNLLVLRTLSKAYALAGFRVGYGIGDPSVVAAIDKFRPPFDVNALAQVAVLAALEEPSVTAANVDEIVAERDRCIAALWAGGLPVGTSQGNFVWVAAGRHTAALADALEAAGFLSRPFADEGLRITISTRATNDQWVSALLDAWHGTAFAPARDHVAAQVRQALDEAMAAGIDLADDGGSGSHGTQLQAIAARATALDAARPDA